MKQLLIILISFIHVAFAANITFTAKVNKNKVAANETFKIVFEVNQSGSNFTPPNNLFNDFKLYQGPIRQQSMRLINNSMTQSYSYTYILIPTKEGKFKIGEASIIIDGKTYTSNTVDITVGKSTQPQQNQSKKQEKNSSQDLSDKIFLTIEPSKTKVYQGEQVFLQFKLYNKTNLVNIQEEVVPNLAGFIVSDIEMPKGAEYAREKVNGSTYEVFTIKKSIIIPQRSGKLEISPLELDAVVQVKEGMIQTWFGPRPNMVNKKVHLKSNKVTIESLALPSPEPENFSGAVGSFEFNSSIDKTELNADEAFTLNIKIKGTGNASLIEPKLPVFQESFEVYDPKITTNSSNKTGVLKGAKSWEYLVIPRVGGEYLIEPVTFVYFEPKSKSYKTLQSEPQTIAVSGNSESLGGKGITGSNRTQVISGTDIRFIHLNQLTLSEAGYFFFRSTYYWLIIGMLVFILLVGIVVLKKQKALHADSAKLKQKQAGKQANKYLKTAAKHLDESNVEAFYEAIEKGMLTYFGDKLNIPKAQLNVQNICEKLNKSSADEATTTKVKDIFDAAQMARYAPSAAREPSILLKDSESIIKQLEEVLK